MCICLYLILYLLIMYIVFLSDFLSTDDVYLFPI